MLWLVSSVTYSCRPSGNGLLLVLLVSGEFDQEFVQVRPSELPLQRPGNRFVVRLEVPVASSRGFADPGTRWALLEPIAAPVKLTSRGAVFFAQDRAGQDGRIFRLVKFRTMRGDRTPDPKELVPLHHPDITPAGFVLRRLKLDELPQLLNVLKGDMSLVGPRPTLPDQAAAYDAFRRQRLRVRPGITGLAQVYGNSLMPWDERILYDVAYVRRGGFLLDAWILLRTLVVVLLGERRMTRRFTDSPFARYVDPP